MNHITIENLERVSKATARKLYEQGRELTLVPCKANVASPWLNGGFMIRKSDGLSDVVKNISIDQPTFDQCVNAFEYYNCQYNELGKYAAFYKVVPNA